jgi:pimeloyl-ACP methyl ester carboxylesterase
MKLPNVRNGDVELSLEVSGEGPTLLLLHGWPDTGALWRDMVPDLVASGYRAAVADLRGCGRSSKPADTASYKMTQLVADVVSIIDALGEEPVTLIGHDWGAALAWAVATYLPERVHSLVALSLGHPTSFYAAGIEQQVKSWYMLLFSQDDLGEAFLRKNDYEAIRRWSGHPRAEEVIEELERDGQMSAHLRWYRANVPMNAFVVDPPIVSPLQVPALGIWSSGDPALTERQMKESGAYCARGFTYVRLEGFGHWLPLEAPHAVSREILNFLGPEEDLS